MPNAIARCATSAPTRPRPMTPRVLPKSSTPSNFERSHLPDVSEACAWGRLRAWAEEQRHRLLGRRQHVRQGRVDDHDAPGGRRGDVDVVEPDPGSTDDDEARPGLEHRAGDLRRRAHDQRGRADHGVAQLGLGQPGRDVDRRARRRAARRAPRARSARSPAHGPRSLLSAGCQGYGARRGTPSGGERTRRTARPPRRGRRPTARSRAAGAPGRRTPRRARPRPSRRRAGCPRARRSSWRCDPAATARAGPRRRGSSRRHRPAPCRSRRRWR